MEGRKGGAVKYLETDDAFRDHAQTAQRGSVFSQALPIDGEVLVKRRH